MEKGGLSYHKGLPYESLFLVYYIKKINLFWYMLHEKNSHNLYPDAVT